MNIQLKSFRPVTTAMVMLSSLTTAVNAQEPASSTAREIRQEARQESQENRQQGRQSAQEARQDARQETRQEDGQATPRGARQEARQEARQQRQKQRMNNRSQYFGTAEDDQFNSWVSRNNVPPLQRVARAAGAAVNTAEAAINTASNLANKIGANVTYGFDNPNPNRTNDWFYDYYSLAPTSFSAVGNGQRYASASRFYDLNNDGVYDSLRTFRDSAQSGRFDAFDRIDFFSGDTNDANNAKATDEDNEDGIDDANHYTITGKIFATKSASVNGTKNLVARLSNTTATIGDSASKQEITLVDLGPMSAWKTTDFKEGTAVTASGSLERVGDKQILVAQTASVGSEKQERISRYASKIEGQVVDVNKTQISGKEHTMVIVDAESKRQIVDLGPSENLKAKIEPQTKITVVGVPVRMRNHSVVLAESATIGDQEVTIKRW